jgi:hypothetical protein
MSITFPVSKVDLGEPGQFKSISLVESIEGLTRIKVESAGSNQTGELIGAHVDRWNGKQTMNGFLRAIHTAYAYHYPLVLSPDDVWVAVAQGFAAHVNAHSEELRSKFVKHDGKVKIQIQRDHFSKGDPNNDWMGGFSEFSDRIAGYIGETTRSLLVSDFSTTGPIEKAASEVILMDVVKSYFDYSCRTLCGIPEVTLLGDREDWMSLRDRAARFKDFGCDWWLQHLLPVLDQFVKVFGGTADPAFWGELYKIGGGSGGPYVTGIVNVFFPYLKGYHGESEPNNFMDWKSPRFGGPTTDTIPSGLSSVPFTWEFYETNYPMVFLGGFVGAVQDGLNIRPAQGWGVADSDENAERPS